MNPFSINNPVTPPIFAGRHEELSKLRNSILLNNESVSVSGFNGIGKSSLILTLLKEIQEEGKAVFPVQISEHQFRNYIAGDFLSTVVHEVCTAIWTQVLGGRFSELLEQSLLYPRDTEINSKHKALVKRIFRIVTSENLGSKGSRNSQVGGKFVFEGRTSETNELSLARKPLVSFEFLLLIDELMEILGERGFKRIIVLCDQLNHIPPKANYEIVSQYFEALSSKNIMFLVSAINRKLDMNSDRVLDTENMLKSFGRWIELNPFSSADQIAEFATNCLAQPEIKPLVIQDKFFNETFNLCEGYPWFVAKLLEQVYSDAVTSKVYEVDSNSINKYGARFARAVSAYKEKEGCVPTVHLESLLS